MKAKLFGLIASMTLCAAISARADTLLSPTITSTADAYAQTVGCAQGDTSPCVPSNENYTTTVTGNFLTGWSTSTDLASAAYLTGAFISPTPITTAPTPFVTGAVSLNITSTDGSGSPVAGYASVMLSTALTYYIEIAGPNGVSVPINYSGIVSVFNPPGLPPPDQEAVAGASLSIPGAGFWSLAYGPTDVINVSGQFNMITNTPVEIQEEQHTGGDTRGNWLAGYLLFSSNWHLFQYPKRIC